MRERIVVTGAAAYAVCGMGKDAFWRALHRDPDTGPPLPLDGTGRFPPYELADERRELFPPHAQSRRLLATIHHDLDGILSGLTADQQDRAGVAIGSGYGHLDSYFDYYRIGSERGYQLTNPAQFPYVMPSSSITEVHHAYGLRGSCTAITSGLGSGVDAVEYGVESLRLCEEGLVLAGAIDEVNAIDQAVLRDLELCSPTGTVRPLHPDRDGTVAADGIAVLLLERERDAQTHGRWPWAEIASVATTRNIRWSGPEGLDRAARHIACTLADAGVRPDEVDIVLPSASGTIAGDAFEHALLDRVFGTRREQLPVLPIKRVIGECFAAAGVFQCLAAALAIACSTEHRDRPPTDAALAFVSGFDGTFGTVVLKSLRS